MALHPESAKAALAIGVIRTSPSSSLPADLLENLLIDVVGMFVRGKLSPCNVANIGLEGAQDLFAQVHVLLDKFRCEPIEQAEDIVGNEALSVTVDTGAVADGGNL